MFIIERTVGRLVEVRLVSPVATAEIEAADLKMLDAVKDAQRSVVICADYRQARVLSDEHTAMMVAMYRRHNQHVEQSAILIAPDSAVSLLQMERVIREANHPQRKAFREIDPLLEWLKPHLSPAERTRAATFARQT